jgi:hypothetical protein
MLLNSKIFSVAVQTDPKEFEAKRKKGIELIDKIAKKYIEISLDPVKSKTQNPFPSEEEIKELKNLTPYLPKKTSNKDYTEIIKILNNTPNSALKKPTDENAKKYKKKYSKPDLKPADVK